MATETANLDICTDCIEAHHGTDEPKDDSAAASLELIHQIIEVIPRSLGYTRCWVCDEHVVDAPLVTVELLGDMGEWS